MTTMGLQAMIAQAAKQNGIPPGLLSALVHQESGGNTNARSPSGAMGLTQLMPATARSLGVQDPNNPMQNLMGGARYLAQQKAKFGSWGLALAAYNAGPGAVAHYGGIPPYAETQNYVRNIMAMAGDPKASASVPGVIPRQTPSVQPQTQTPAATQPPPPDVNSLLQPGLSAPDVTAPSPSLDAAQVGGGDMTNQLLQQEVNTPIPLPQTQPQPPAAAQGAAGSVPDQAVAPPDPTDNPHIPLQGLDGQAAMVTGGVSRYPNIQFSSQADFHHVNPQLLAILQKVGEKQGVHISVISGYRSNDYSARNGGFAGDPHTKGLAVDAYVNGHPIGEVIPPDVWAKLGVRSGATKGFYKGKSDPEHLDLIGMPVKGGKK